MRNCRKPTPKPKRYYVEVSWPNNYDYITEKYADATTPKKLARKLAKVYARILGEGATIAEEIEAGIRYNEVDIFVWKSSLNEDELDTDVLHLGIAL